MSEEDEKTMRRLLQHHPKSEEKIGCGIDYIKVSTSPCVFSNQDMKNEAIRDQSSLQWKATNVCHAHGVSKINRHSTFNKVRCFWIVRTDGTETDFSYHKCVKAKIAIEYPNFVDSYDAVHRGKSIHQA